MKISFTKMHGTGNDYIYIDCFRQELPDPAKFAIKWSDRHKGIGGDGIILIMPSDKADCRMRMFNADGSEGRMCGNGIRCVGKFVYDNGLVRKANIAVETMSGIKKLDMIVSGGVASGARVDMGAPVLEPSAIPVIWENSASAIIGQPVVIGGKTYKMTCVSMGNPHAIVFTEGIDALKLGDIGPLFENDAHFPEKVNTEFVEVLDKKTLKMRVWERGSGETLACGTGACATVVAAVLNGHIARGADTDVILKGGTLSIRWEESGSVVMTGPAEKVFDGTIEF